MHSDVIKKMKNNPRIWFAASVLTVMVILALGAGTFAPFSPADADISLRLAKPSSQHWFGCDLNGADVFTLILYGARISLYIAFVTVFFSVTVGLFIGLVCGYKRGLIDTVMMRVVEILMAVPTLLVALILTSLLGASINNIILAIAVTGWTSSARIVRGQVLTLKEREFVMASKALGASDFRLIFRHIFPLTLTPILVHATFSLSAVIIIESSLSFLGLGVQDDTPTWGALLGQGRTVLTEAPHLCIIPGIAILLVVLALNFLGDGLRDALDPKKVR